MEAFLTVTYDGKQLIMPFQAVGGSYSNIWSAGIPGSVDTEDVSSNLANLPIIPSRRG